MQLGGGTYTNNNGAQPIDNYGIIRGRGTINGHIRNHAGGTVQVGDPNQIGTLDLFGDFTQDAGGFLDIVMSAPGHSVLNVYGTASLGGKLTVTMVGGYVPDVGDQFSVMTFATSNGSFDNDTIDLGGGLYFAIEENPLDVNLVASN